MTKSTKRCPDCKTELGISILVPYYWVCPECECYWNPKRTKSKLLKSVWHDGITIP